MEGGRRREGERRVRGREGEMEGGREGGREGREEEREGREEEREGGGRGREGGGGREGRGEGRVSLSLILQSISWKTLLKWFTSFLLQMTARRRRAAFPRQRRMRRYVPSPIVGVSVM